MLRYKTETRPGLVALYDIRPGNGARPFLQPRSPHGAGGEGGKGAVAAGSGEGGSGKGGGGGEGAAIEEQQQQQHGKAQQV